MLDDFGPDNWTSELRAQVPGFAPFRAQAYADFTYPDSYGQLTRTWFGPEKAAAWQGRWSRYYIEVKSSRGGVEEAFHMSRFQMATVRPPRPLNEMRGLNPVLRRPLVLQAFAFMEGVQLHADMYIVVCVCPIATSEPYHVVYPDPHRALFLGKLQYASDVFLQRNLAVAPLPQG